MKPIEILTKEVLHNEYVLNKLSIHKIAKKYNLKSSNSVAQLIKKYNLRRDTIVRSAILTKETLIQKYITENKSIKTIANELGYQSKQMIVNALDKYNIQRRKFTNSTLKIKESRKRRGGFRGISGKYFSSLMFGAKRRNIEFNITIEYIWWLYKKQKMRCKLTNNKIYFHKLQEHFTQQTASLDRIDSNKGYIEGNVQWLHKDVNRVKNIFTEDYLIRICKQIAKQQGNKC